MVAKEAVVCPKCGALNRRIWPFCARCNESLAGAAPADLPEDAAAAEKPASRPRKPVSIVTLLTLLALVAGGAWIRYAAKHPPAPGPNPAIFTMGTLPSAAPTPPTLRPAPGLEDYQAGHLALARGDLQTALVRLAAAVLAGPDNAEYHKEYASALWRHGETDRALGEQAEAVRLDPRLRLAYARMLDAAGRSDAARSEYEAVLTELPNAATVHQDVGRMLFRNGDYVNAAVHLQQAAAAQPGDPVLLQELAYALEQTGDHERATAAYREILQRAPGASVTRQHLSESLYQQGQKDEAIAVLKEGLAAAPETPLLLRQLGRLLALSGRSAEAIAAYKSYLQAAPNAPDARDMAERIAALEGGRRSEP
jgi:Flp pilus assembly protein TadD